MSRDPNIIIALYTCKAHQHLHKEFYASSIGQTLQSFPNARFIEAFADQNLLRSELNENRLTVATEEAYANLCRKTFEMISILVRRTRFDYLLKVDVTSGIESMNQDERIRNRVQDPAVMVEYLEALKGRIASGEAADYEGWKQINASRDGIERWAGLKGLKVNLDAIFGDRAIPLYYSGKCYMMSRPLAEYSALSGQELAEKFTSNLPGGEDLLVGCWNQDFMNERSSDSG